MPVEEETDFSDAEWINHGGNVGYVFPQDNSHQNIKAQITRNGYFQCWINHGINPVSGSYEYAILPGADKSETEAYAENPDVEILINSNSVQAVRNNRLGITGAVFWEAGSFNGITVSEPVILMYKIKDGKFSFSVSDPTHKLTDAQICFDRIFAIKNSDSKIQSSVKNNKTVLNIDFKDSDGKSIELRGRSNDIACIDMYMGDKNGNIINKFKSHESDEINLSAKIANMTTDDCGVFVLIASYSGNKLVSCKLEKYNVPNESCEDVTLLKFNPGDSRVIKYFIWNNKTLQPVEIISNR